ncbi:hypothetical protein DPMN_152939 [Dreissena polymorpha]|nr:hypothetical protein DPMN_152939 [Dreissena polymorpha]
MKSLQTSYEYVLDEILKLRRQISETFDRLQQETIRKLEQLHSSLKISLENESKQCVEFISKLKEYDIYCSENICSERSFIINKKCLDQAASADSFLRKQIKNAYIEFQHNKDLKQYLDSCTELGNITIHEAPQRNCVDPNRVVSVKDQSQFKVQSTTDGHVCFITGICEAFNGEIIIADANNQCVKLLDQAFNLIEQLQLPASPHFISKISPNELVVACGQSRCVRQIHFLRVDKGRIVKRNNIELEQDCHGMAIHQGDLFVTTSTVVWQLTMEGRLVKKLYEEKSRHFMGRVFLL